MELAFFNGDFVPREQLKIPVDDMGFMLGVTIAEQIRTFRRSPFWLSRHLNRLRHGISHLNTPFPIESFELSRVVHKLIEENGRYLPDDHDLGVTIFVTPGVYPIYAKTEPMPTIAVHTYPLPFRIWGHKYEMGQIGSIVSVRQIPPNCWSAELKCRSRMHYFLANQEARAKNADATAILLDQDGYVSESPIANIVAVFPSEGLVSPPIDDILPGISLEYLCQLGHRLGGPVRFRKIRPAELFGATELFLTSTPFCILPLLEIDGSKIGSGKPGPHFRRIIQNWSIDAGLDIQKQAEKHA